jgi:hypothetical protein
MTKPQQVGLQPTLLTIPDQWNPEIALAVFELIDDLRDQIWSRYGQAIQDELRRQLELGHERDDNTPPLQQI